MIAPPQFLVALAQPWADFYSDSKVAATVVTFGHVGALLFAGGTAISADLFTLRGSLRGESGGAARARHVGDLSGLHQYVISGIVVMVATGILMLAADLEAYYGSWVYWTKMALFVGLLANGRRIVGLEQALRKSIAEPPPQETVTDVGAEFPPTDASVPATTPLPSTPTPPTEPSEWQRLRGAAKTSLTLWFTITFFGILLVNAA